MRNWRVAVLGLLVPAIGLTGCGGGKGGVEVTQVPKWDFQHYERIAVLPVKAADPRAARDAGVLTERLTTLVAGSGAFTVLSRADMQAVFAEQDLSKLADDVDRETALPEGQIKVAQALVAAKITDYKLIAERERKARPVFARDPRGRVLLDRAGRPIVAGEEVVDVFRHGAEVEGSVRVVDAATGKILVSHTARIAAQPRVGYGRPPRERPEDLAAAAVQDLAMEFYKTVAPTRIRVKLKKDMLVIATDYFDGRYHEPKRLSRELADFLLVVRDLPEQCDRNEFRVALAEEQGHENLLEQEFVWSGSTGPEGVSFHVPLKTVADTGGEKFVAKLYSGRDPEPILKRTFSLEKVEVAQTSRTESTRQTKRSRQTEPPAQIEQVK